MSKERIVKALEQLGLSNTDTQIYVFLAKNGPHSEREICEILELQKRQVYPSLKSLQGIKIVKAIGKHPVQFSVVPFEEVINLFIEVKKEQAKIIQESREELLSSWRETIKKENTKS